MAAVREFYYPSSDGIHQVHAMAWEPEGEKRGVVQIVHGLSEYVGRYDRFARFLAEHRFAVYGADHLGHGLTASDKKYGFFGEKDGWKHVIADVRRMREIVGEECPELPCFLFGHSMGSFLTRMYLMLWPGTVTGAVLSGTGQESRLNVFLGRHIALWERRRLGPEGRSQVVQAISLGAYNKKFAPNRTPADWISRDKAVVDAYLADPLCQFAPTVSMFADMMEGLQFIGSRERLNTLDRSTPIYLFSGDHDPVGNMGKGVRKVCEMYRKAGVEDLTMKLYPGGRHEMLNELNWEEVYGDTLAWLEAHLPRKAAQAEAVAGRA